MDAFSTTQGTTKTPAAAIRPTSSAGEAVDAGVERHPGRVGGQRVRDREHAVPARLGDARVESGLVEHRQAGVALHRAVVDHELDVVRPGRDQLRHEGRRLLGRGGERHQWHRPGGFLLAGVGARPELEVVRDQLARVAAGWGDAEPGRAHVGERVVVGDPGPVGPRVHALHLELGGDPEPQREREGVVRAVGVCVDQARQQGRAGRVDDLGRGRGLPADRGDPGAVDNDRRGAEHRLAVEHPRVRDGSEHVVPRFLSLVACFGEH